MVGKHKHGFIIKNISPDLHCHDPGQAARQAPHPRRGGLVSQVHLDVCPNAIVYPQQPPTSLTLSHDPWQPDLPRARKIFHLIANQEQHSTRESTGGLVELAGISRGLAAPHCSAGRRRGRQLNRAPAPTSGYAPHFRCRWWRRRWRGTLRCGPVGRQARDGSAGQVKGASATGTEVLEQAVAPPECQCLGSGEHSLRGDLAVQCRQRDLEQLVMLQQRRVILRGYRHSLAIRIHCKS